MSTSQKIIALISIVAILAIAIWAVAQPSRWKVIAAYRTGLAGRTNAQVHNLKLAVRSINGKVIPPHGEFSFNHTVGSWTAERGYVKAPVSFDGELIPAWGGGVCQASTTLYNSALLSGMNILERHRHKFPAKYAPPGQDAAVAQYNIDFRFKNPYDTPVRIETEIKGDWMICKILSQKPLGREITVENEVRQVTAPTEVVRFSESNHNRRWRVVNHGQPGMRVAVYRRVTEGSTSKRTLISEDTYPPMNRLVKR